MPPVHPMRAYLEARALALTIPFTHLSHDKDLLALVIAYEQGRVSAASRPDCFGEVWEAATDEACQGCLIQTACLKAFSDHVASLQGTPASIAQALEVDVASVTSARAYLDFWDRINAPPAARSKPSKKPPPPSRPSVKNPAPPSRRKRHPPPSSLPQPDVVPAAGGAVFTPTTNASAASATAPDAAKGATSRRPRRRVGRPTATPETPTVTPPPAADPMAAELPPARAPWGEHTFLPRWLRERERCPDSLGRLRPGDVLHRMFAGEQVTVKVAEGHYEYKSRKYPTLYSVVTEITGGKEYPVDRPRGTRRISNWSAARFFRQHFAQMTQQQESPQPCL